MDTGKPIKTAADYMVIALCPVFIIVMVHSLCFFLVDVFYRGEGIGGVHWVLFWFILAVVLITRIGIEQDEAHAIGYGLALTGAVLIYLLFVQTNLVFGAILLAIVWFSAHKLTSNCTLVDDDEDASGQGLMQLLLHLPAPPQTTPTAEPVTDPTPAPTPSQKIIRPPRPAPPPSTRKKKRLQTPGTWLLYFSIAAVPIFGLGQTLLPADDALARHHAFVYLFLYLAAALGLLITTSFLGLRRYLRQRYVTMPGKIALGWIQTGVIAIVMVLCLALLLPRPGAHEAWSTLRYHVDHQLRKASDYAAKFNPHGTGSGKSGNDTAPNGQDENKTPSASDQNTDNKGNDQGKGDQKSGNGSGGESGGGGSGGQSSGGSSGHAGDQGKGGDQPDNKEVPKLKAPDLNAQDNGPGGVSMKPTPKGPPQNSAFSWLRILFWLAVAIALGWLCYRYRAMILAMLQSIWAAIQSFIAMLRGLFKRSAPTPLPLGKKFAIPAFKTFKNPFLTGGAQVWPPERLIAYTYTALQSWVLEQEATRGSHKTPREFCHQLAEEMPEATDALEHLSLFYGHVAYGASLPGNYDAAHLRLLWDYMANPRVKVEMTNDK